MPQGARKYKVTITSTSLVTVHSQDQFGETVVTDAFERLTVNNVNLLRTFDIPGLASGEIAMNLQPTTSANALVVEWNLAIANQEVITVIIDQVNIGGETPAPSADNIRWQYTGHAFSYIGGPVEHGQIKMWDAVLSIQTIQYEAASGVVVLL